MRRVVCTLQSQPVPEVLQPILPSGFAAGDRTRTAVAATSAARSTATAARPVPRALSSLTGIGHSHTTAYASFAPRRRKGREGLGAAPGPPLPFSDSAPGRQGDESVPRRSGVSRAAGPVGRSLPPLSAASAPGRHGHGAVAAPLGPVRTDRGHGAAGTAPSARWLHTLGGRASGARHDHAVWCG